MCSSGLLKFFAVVGTSNAYFHQEHNLISFRGVRKKVRRTESAHLCSPPPSPVHNVALNSKPGIAARSGSFLQGQKHSRSHNIGFWGYGGYASIDTSMVARTFFSASPGPLSNGVGEIVTRCSCLARCGMGHCHCSLLRDTT